MTTLFPSTASKLELRPYQAEAIAAVEAVAQYGPAKPVLEMATGLGKTVVFCEIARRRGPRALILVHRDELVRQTVVTLEQVWPTALAGVVQAEEDEWDAEVVVASVQSLRAKRLRRWEPGHFQTLVVDECFPAGTMVGGRRIEQLRPGDQVPSWDESTGQFVERQVLRTMTRSAPALVVTLTMDTGEQVTCTPNHPLRTPEGWRAAGTLAHGAYLLSSTHHANTQRGGLHGVRDASSADGGRPDQLLVEVGASVLLDRASGRMGEARQVCPHGADQSQVRLGPHEGQQSDGSPGVLSQDEGDPNGYWAPPPSTWGEWNRGHGAPMDAGAAPGVAHRGGGDDWQRVSATPLQVGHSPRGSEGGDRSGWALPWNKGAQRGGPAQGRVAAWRRVVCVEVHESGGDGGSQGLCPDGLVYNLEVAGTHAYLIGSGIVAHNCHHGASPTYQRVIGWLKAPLLLGVTATPYRGDKLSIAPTFTDGVVYSYAAPQGIKDGWLCDAIGYRPGTDVMLDSVPTKAGDFDESALSTLVDTPARNLVAVQATLKYAPGRRTVAFAASVDHAHHLAAMFRSQGVTAAAIDGTMAKSERREILRRFQSGELRVLANYGILTEGYDDTSVGAILMARPTKLLGLWTQMVGRGLRMAPGKSDCVIIDLADTTTRHKLIGMHCLIGAQRPVRDGVKLTIAVKELEREREPWMIFAAKLRRTSEVDVAIYDKAAAQAASAGDRPEDNAQEMWEEIKQLRDFEEATVFSMATEPQRKALTGFGWPSDIVVQMTRQEASMALDRLAQIHKAWVRERVPMLALALDMPAQAVNDQLLGKDSGLWRLHGATDKQLAMLRTRSVPAPASMTKGEASLVLDKLLGGGKA